MNSDLNKAKKGTPQYDEWLRKYKEKRKKTIKNEKAEIRAVYFTALQEKKARTTAGEIAQQLTELFERSSSSNEKELGEHEYSVRERKILSDWIKTNDCFFEEADINASEDLHDMEVAGAESIIFYDSASNNVIKLCDPFVTTNKFSDFLHERVYLQNLLFPDTAYTLEGFTIYKDTFRCILSQPYIKGEAITSLSELSDYMEGLGFEYNIDKCRFENELFCISDIHPGNILKTGDNQYAFIDTIIWENSEKNKNR